MRGVDARLTRTHEANEAKHWKIGDAPQDYLDTLLKAIIGLEIKITRLVGKRKLGQNKEVRDIHGAGDALVARGHDLGLQMLEIAAHKAVQG